MTAKTILIVEDDPEIGSLLTAFLTREGFTVEIAEDGASMDDLLTRLSPHIMILDLMLPGEDGLSICRRLKQAKSWPILMLTAKNEDIDRIVGLELGADDYLCKPFSPQELLARIRAILRRIDGVKPAPTTRRLAFARFVMEPDSRSLETADGQPVTLTSAEFDLLQSFVEHPQRVLSRDQLLSWGHGRSSDSQGRAIDVTVSHLRRKLAAWDPDIRAMIATARGDGYLFDAPVKTAAVKKVHA